MQKFKKKDSGLVVEAAKVGDTDINQLANWAQSFVVEEKDALTHEVSEALNVRTPEGMKRASKGMYVVKLDGHIFVSQPGGFEAQYEALMDPELPEKIKDPTPKFSSDIQSLLNEGPKQI